MPNNDEDVKVGELYPVQSDVPHCFVCGPENPAGLKLRFRKESPKSPSTTFKPPPEWTGWGDIMHGGFQALVLDETMSWVAFKLTDVTAFVTRDIQLRYLRPVKINQELAVVATLEDSDGTLIKTSGRLIGENDKTLTSATATIQRVDPIVIAQKQGT